MRRIASAHDVGKSLNTLSVDGQIVGGVVMGLGYALHERLQFDQGRIVNPSFMDYKIPSSQEIPEITPIAVEVPLPEGPFGAKGIGELAIVGIAPCIGNAIYDALGVRLKDLPLHPERVLEAVESQRKDDGSVEGPAFARNAVSCRHSRPIRVGMHGMQADPPGSLDEALAAREQYTDDALPIAGGQSLLVMMRNRLVAPAALIDLEPLEALRGVEVQSSGISIGAMNTCRQLIASPVLREEVGVLPAAARQVSSTAVRNLGTIGGNVCHNEPGADLPPALLALNGRAVLRRRTDIREVPLADFFTGYFETVLEPDEILCRIDVEHPPAGAVGVYLKHAISPEDLGDGGRRGRGCARTERAPAAWPRCASASAAPRRFRFGLGRPRQP